MDVLELFRNSKHARRFSAGETVFRQGEPGDVMYVITSGEVSITRDGKTVESLAPGDIFGEMALIDSRPRSGTATTLSEAELVPIDQEWFSFLIRKNPSFALHVMSLMAERLRRFMQAAA